jgi:hypothetical protein
MTSKLELSRRAALLSLLGTTLVSRPAEAFGESGAFSARLLSAGKRQRLDVRKTGLSRWAQELVQRTSAPGRTLTTEISADQPALFREPFAVWAGDSDTGPLSATELRGLERFIKLGGVLLVDDSAPESGAFGRAARRELRRVLPEAPPVRLPTNHVVFRSFYLLERPVGRVLGPAQIEAIVRGRTAQVLFLEHDLLGALARGEQGFALEVTPGGIEQRERAVRFAVNIAMYVLCSDYKDDQVHASWLMRRRGQAR